jgi:hypothetical protein
MATLEVMSGMWTVEFEGTKVAGSDSKKTMPPGLVWSNVDPRDARSYLRWVEMALYKVAPGQDGEHIELPDGGYFYTVVHQTVCYHRHPSPCDYKGVPKERKTLADLTVLPCPECRPLPVWEPDPEDDTMEVIADPDGLAELEPVRYELYRDETPLAAVRRVTGKRLTVPAGLLLEIARQNDPAIRAVFARPGR